MKFLIDVNIGKSIESFLIEKGFDIICVRDLDPRMKDEQILKIAAEENRIIITMDNDFGRLVFQYKSHHAGILILEINEKSLSERKDIIIGIINEIGLGLEKSFTMYKKNQIRIRKI